MMNNCQGAYNILSIRHTPKGEKKSNNSIKKENKKLHSKPLRMSTSNYL